MSVQPILSPANLSRFSQTIFSIKEWLPCLPRWLEDEESDRQAEKLSDNTTVKLLNL